MAAGNSKEPRYKIGDVVRPKTVFRSWLGQKVIVIGMVTRYSLDHTPTYRLFCDGGMVYSILEFDLDLRVKSK